MNANTTFAKLRDQVPLVHCITNYVAMNIAANVTLAAGASPAMIHAEEEVADFASFAAIAAFYIVHAVAEGNEECSDCRK